MTESPLVTVPHNLSCAAFLHSFILRKRHAYYPVRLSVSIAVPGRFQDHEERVVNVIVGVASLANLKKARLNRNHLAYIPISEIITPLDSVPCVEPATATLELVRLLSEEQNHRLLVTRSLPRTLKEYTRSLLASTWDRRGSDNDGHRRGHGNGTGHEDRATQDNGTYLAPPTPAPAHAKHDRHDRHGADAADLMMAGRPSTTSTGGSKDSIDSSRPSDWRGSGLEGEAEAVGERKNEKTGGREMGLAQCIDLESGESAHHRQTARTQPSCTQPPCAQAGDGAEDSGGTFAPLSSLDPDDSATSASPLRMDYTQSPSRRYSPPHRTYSAPTLQHHHQQQQYQHQQHRRSPYRSSSPSVYAALPMSTNSGALDNVLVIPEEDLLGIISYSDVVGYLETTSVLQPLARYSQAGEGQDRSGQLSEMQREEERQRQLQLQADRRARHRAQEEEHAEPGGHRGDKGGDEQLTMDTLHQRGVHDSCGEDKGEGRDDRFTAVGDSVGGGVMGESGHWPHYSTFDD